MSRRTFREFCHLHEKMKKLLLGGVGVSIFIFFVWVYSVSLHRNDDHMEFNDPSEAIPNILLVSTWRSGSSWTGAFLKALPDTYYLYEPLHALRDPAVQDHGFYIPPESSISLIKQLFQCTVPDSVYKDALRWRALYKPDMLCSPPRCDLTDVMERHCMKSERKAMKTVRLRLGSVEDLLDLKSLAPLKIVYLVRDPRAIFESMHKMSSDKAQVWTLSPRQICTKLVEDSYSFRLLNGIYPGKLLFLRYEDLTRDPEGMLQRLADFVQEDSVIFEIWKDLVHAKVSPNNQDVSREHYLHKHKKSSRGNYFSINKSITNWEAWRNTIPVELVSEVQRTCAKAMKEFGYVSMGNMEDVRSMKLPSVKGSSCFLPPCE